MAALIREGHAFSEVRRYSLRQVQAFLDLALREKKEDCAASLITQRVAYHASPENFEKYRKTLE